MASTPDDGDRRPVAPPGRPQPSGWTPPSGGAPPVKAKTSAAAVFAVVFGLSSVIVGLLLVLAPIAIVFGLLAMILGVIGMRNARKSNVDDGTLVTGRGVAIGGLLLGLLGLLLGVAVLVGAAALLSERVNLERVERGLQNLREEIPSELPT